VKRIVVLLIFGAVCFAAGVCYDAHAQRKAREAAFNSSYVPQSPQSLPARILWP
jgi:hypothetical protein